LDSINNHVAFRLNWNDYINWPEGVKEYLVYVKINNSNWDSLSSVNGSISEFYHQNLMDSTAYCYFIRAVSNLGRTSSSNQTCFFSILPGGIKETKNNENNIVIYPNPTTNVIQIIGKQYSISSIEICNLQSKIIFNSKVTSHFSPITIDVSLFPKGIYIVSIKSGEKIFHQKLIKQ
jgi:hypothetical protein